MPFNLWDILILVSLAQGLLFGLVLLISRFFRGTHSQYLAYSIMMVSIIGLNEWLSGWNFDDQYYLIDLLGDDVPWILLFYVPLLIYFWKASGHPLGDSKKQTWLLLPFTLFLGLNLFINLDVDFGLYEVPKVRAFMFIVYEVEFWLALWYTVLLAVWACLAIRRMEDSEAGKKWLMRIWRFTSALILIWLILDLIPTPDIEFYTALNYILWGSISFFIYWLTYQGLYQFKLAKDQQVIHQLLEKPNPVRNPEDSAPQEALPREKAYLQQLEQLMEEAQIHRNPDLSRDEVADSLGISPGYLSQVINSATNGNFSTFINDARVGEVKKMLADPAFDQYSLLAIGKEAGFRSKSAFYTTFKKTTGMTPSAFKKSTHFSDSDNPEP